jgi:Kef-type K+ transport system membrane component KefB
MIPTNLFFYIGIALIIGFLLGKATNWLRLTAIVGYIIAGIILGPLMNIIMEENLSFYAMNMIVDITLGLVGFIIGIGFTRGFIRRFGKMAFGIAIVQSIVTFFIVFLGTYLITNSTSLSLILGVIGLATAPAGTIAAIQLLRGRGQLSRMTVAVVGIDDGIGIIFFAFILSVVKFLLGDNLELYEMFTIPLFEIGGAILIGGVFGIALAYIGKIVKHREDVFIVAISFLLMCVGICEIVHASSILACMILGMAFINLAPQIGRIANSNIEGILPPIYVVFFAIAGLELSLRYESIIEFGIYGTVGLIIVYIVYRIIGKVAGTLVAGISMKAPESVQKYMGYALLSQAGVALGLAILVNNELSQYSDAAQMGALVITVITLTTIFFEILGPIGVKYALTKAKESHEQ